MKVKADDRLGADLAFDVGSSVALAVKRRLFDLLGVFPYHEALTDGMQVRILPPRF